MFVFVSLLSVSSLWYEICWSHFIGTDWGSTLNSFNPSHDHLFSLNIISSLLISFNVKSCLGNKDKEGFVAVHSVGVACEWERHVQSACYTSHGEMGINKC